MRVQIVFVVVVEKPERRGETVLLQEFTLSGNKERTLKT